MLKKEEITDVFFDWDHTLWDFEKNSALTFEKIFGSLNIQLNIDDFLKAYEPINHQYWKLYRENKISQKELRQQRLIKTFEEICFDYQRHSIDQISELYIQHLSTFPHLFEGALSLLQTLRQKYRLHIITNGFEAVQHRKIKNSGLAPFFNHIFTAEKVGCKKPNPIFFQYAIAASKTSASSSLMIGDSLEADVLGALNAGMQAIHFNTHNEPAHLHCPMVYRLEEIKNFL